MCYARVCTLLPLVAHPPPHTDTHTHTHTDTHTDTHTHSLCSDAVLSTVSAEHSRSAARPHPALSMYFSLEYVLPPRQRTSVLQCGSGHVCVHTGGRMWPYASQTSSE